MRFGGEVPGQAGQGGIPAAVIRTGCCCFTYVCALLAAPGGLANQLTTTIEGAKIKDYLNELIPRITQHDKIQVLTNALIVSFGGFKGNFTTELLV